MRSFGMLLLGLVLGAVLGVWAYQRHQQSLPPEPATPCPVCEPLAIVPDAVLPSPTVPIPARDPHPPAAPPLTVVDRMAAAAAIGTLAIPVQGIAREQLLDTFTDARSEGRSHDAIDIMAPAGTPVLAVADGTVEKLFDSERGGLTLYQFEPSGRYAYYYAHLQAYAPGIVEGATLRRGQVIGTVGSTGNANPDAPHLHFAIMLLSPERNWWQGDAINPYPLLRGGVEP